MEYYFKNLKHFPRNSCHKFVESLILGKVLHLIGVKLFLSHNFRL